MDKWNVPADSQTIEETTKALKENSFNVIFAKDEQNAKKKFFEVLPDGAEVLHNSSVTLDTLGITKEIDESGKYDSVKNKLKVMDRKTQNREMQRLGSAPEWAVGSVHAVTRDGHILIASRSGSQIPGYSYGADHVIWVVGVQKIVENIDQGIKRIYEHSLPLESERVKRAYGMEKSEVSKIFIFNKEIKENRSTVIFIDKVIGY
jgi:L-lactate utilization protein LutC